MAKAKRSGSNRERDSREGANFVMFTFRIDPIFREAIEAAAAKFDRTASSYAREALREILMRDHSRQRIKLSRAFLERNAR